MASTQVTVPAPPRAYIIKASDLTAYGISASGEQINAGIADLFAAMPNYTKLIVPWTKSGDTSRFGTLSSDIPTGANFGMLTIEKGINMASCVFSEYNTETVYVAAYSTTNNVGFSGWGRINTTSV